MEEKNNTPNKLDFISKFRAQYQVPKNVPNEMVEFFPSFEHAWAGWCMACPSQPTQSVGLTIDQCTDAVLHLIHGTHDLNWFDNNDGDGFSSDEHEFRHLREKLSAILARQTAPTAVQQGDTDDERREAWKNGYSAGFAATQRIYAEEIDVRHKFEMWKSNRGESAIYEGDGRYNNVGVTEQFEAFAAGVEVGCAADRPAANAADRSMSDAELDRLADVVDEFDR